MVEVISLSEQAYLELKRTKRKGESYFDVVLRLSKGNQGSIAEFVGA